MPEQCQPSEDLVTEQAYEISRLRNYLFGLKDSLESICKAIDSVTPGIGKNVFETMREYQNESNAKHAEEKAQLVLSANAATMRANRLADEANQLEVELDACLGTLQAIAFGIVKDPQEYAKKALQGDRKA